jgi:hypothetical protein
MPKAPNEHAHALPAVSGGSLDRIANDKVTPISPIVGPGPYKLGKVLFAPAACASDGL